MLPVACAHEIPAKHKQESMDIRAHATVQRSTHSFTRHGDSPITDVLRDTFGPSSCHAERKSKTHLGSFLSLGNSESYHTDVDSLYPSRGTM